jgi:hypothetical protein
LTSDKSNRGRQFERKSKQAKQKITTTRDVRS